MRQYKDESFISAVKSCNEGGDLASTIASIIGCNWSTARARLESLVASGKIKKEMLGEKYTIYSV